MQIGQEVVDFPFCRSGQISVVMVEYFVTGDIFAVFSFDDCFGDDGEPSSCQDVEDEGNSQIYGFGNGFSCAIIVDDASVSQG